MACNTPLLETVCHICGLIGVLKVRRDYLHKLVAVSVICLLSEISRNYSFLNGLQPFSLSLLPILFTNVYQSMLMVELLHCWHTYLQIAVVISLGVMPH